MSERTESLLDPERIARLGSLELIARTVVKGSLRGVHRSPTRGSSVEFSENRPYAPGDEVASIDWRAWAKTDRLYCREFEDETNARVTFLLDTSSSMGYGDASLSKLRYASILVAALGHVFVQQLDAVGLMLFDDDLRLRIAPRATRGHFRGVLHELESVRAGGETGLGAVLARASEALPSRGIVVVLSDFIDEARDVLHGLGRIRASGSEVIAFHVMHRDERELPFDGWTVLRDAESPAREVRLDAGWIRESYRARVLEHIERLREGCRAARITYQLCDTSTPFDTALSRFLTSRKHGEW